RSVELLAEAEAAERAASEEREAAERERAEARRLAERARERGDALAAELESVRASAARAREQARAEAEQELQAARAELQALRDEIRAARRYERQARQAATPAAARAESERDRRLGEASTRVARTEQQLRALEAPLPLEGPLGVGDPVEAPAIGLLGTIASIDADEAEVVGAGGQRVRIALARLRPRATRDEPDQALQPAVRVLASARSDIAGELDVRGRRAEETRDALRSYIDDAALAGLAQVRVVHGRGTGALRAAVREELDRHPLVERHQPESSDGATVVYLAR